MNLVSKKLSLVCVASGVLLFAGCQKTPVRPDPGQTNLGVPVGPPRNDQGFMPQGVPTNDIDSKLAQRGPNDVIDDGTTIRNQFGAASQVFFDFDRSDIKQSERAKFPAVKEYLEKNPGTRVLFE